ncbi:hypothetical protein RI367_004471 [Sorochytrium milnesiophthora]
MKLPLPASLLLLASVTVSNAGIDFTQEGCNISLNFTGPVDPQPLPAPVPNQAHVALDTTLSLLRIATGLIPEGGAFLSAAISVMRVIFDLVDTHHQQSPQEIANKMSKEIVQWTRDMFKRKELDSVRLAQEILLGTLARAAAFNMTTGGMTAIYILHEQYVNNVQSFFPEFHSLEESLYENTMGQIQFYVISYLGVARAYIDYQKWFMEKKCRAQFPDDLRLPNAVHYNVTASEANVHPRIRRRSGLALSSVQGCSGAKADLETSFMLVNNHLKLLHELLMERVVATLRAKYIGEPYPADEVKSRMEAYVEQGKSWYNGEFFWVNNSTSAYLHWGFNLNPGYWLSANFAHRLSPIYTCVVKGDEQGISLYSASWKQWQLYRGGYDGHTQLERLVQAYRTGPMAQVEKYIQDAVQRFADVALQTADSITADHAATAKWLNKQTAQSAVVKVNINS